jgi:branched-chain amino acid transport system substrate-binding protein
MPIPSMPSRRAVLAGGLAVLGAGASPLAWRGRRAWAQADPILIALAAPMTGNSAAFGLNAQRGAEFASEAINAAGGIAGRPVTFEVFDDRGTPRDSAAVAQSIAEDDRFFAVLGHVNSSSTLAAMPIYAEVGLPVLNASSSNPTITEQGWSNFIRMTIRGDYGAQQYSAYAINNLGRRRLGIVFANNDFGRALRDDMIKAVAVLPGEVVAEAGFTPGVDKDFAAVITDFRAREVDAIMLNTEYTEGGLFVGQAKGLGLTDVAVVGPDTLLYDSYIELSQGAADGTTILAAYDPFRDDPLTRSFMDGFVGRYDSLPSQVAVFTHDLFYLLKEAVEVHDATSATLIETVKSMRVNLAGGAYAWNAKGDVTDRTFAVIRVENGAFVSTGAVVDETGLEAIR